MSLHINNPELIDLPLEVEQILKVMFAGYQRVVIRRKFGNNLSGGHVIEVRPIKNDDTPELPTVVKLASISLIQKEWAAYQLYIHHKLPSTARVVGEPVLLTDIGWGGLRYSLIGSGTFGVMSLGDYCAQAEVTSNDIRFVLERLFRVMHQIWGHNRAKPEFGLQASYDRLLPVDLLVKYPRSSFADEPNRVTPDNLILMQALKPGDPVYLTGFAVSKVDLVNQTVTLSQPGAASNFVRLKSPLVKEMAAYQKDQIIESIEGEVIETRAGRLRDEIERVLGYSFDPLAQTIPLPNGTHLPNPLVNLATLLHKTRNIKIATIHGDFNLQNILIEPDTRIVGLIDFAEARQDHLLHDCLRLETEVTTQLLAEILHHEQLPTITTLASFYWQLHQATLQTSPVSTKPIYPGLEKPLTMLTIIRQRARIYFFDPDDCSEYYQGLTLYLLGALKFKNLDKLPQQPLPKQVAFWAAVLAYQFFITGSEDLSTPPPSIAHLIDAHISAHVTTDLTVHEQIYRNRVRESYQEDARGYVPLRATTTEITLPSGGQKALRSARRRKLWPEYYEWIKTEQEIKLIKLDTLREAIENYRCVVLLGDPGSGKTAALQHLAYQFIDEPDKLPIPLRLSEFSPRLSVEDFILQSWGGALEANHWGAAELAANFKRYLEQGKLFLLFDGLNEMPHEGYRERAAALRRFINQWSPQGNYFLVACRILDYGEELDGLQRVEIQPLTDKQIQEFLQNELPDNWATLWDLLGEGDVEIPQERTIAFRKSDIENDPRRLLEMARTPLLLTIMIDIFTFNQNLGQSKVELMTSFIWLLMRWAKQKTQPDEWVHEEIQLEALSALAFEMQRRSGFGAMVNIEQVKAVMPEKVQLNPDWPPVPTQPDKILNLAANANIIEMPLDHSSVRFYHQLLQEYFAARHLAKQNPDNLADLWRSPWLEAEMSRPGHWDAFNLLPPPPSTGWEETTILAAGLVSGNDHQLIQTLIGVNPVLAGRCLHETSIKVGKRSRQAVIDALLDTIHQPEIALRVRIAAGDILGRLGDPRLGEMITIPDGAFFMGEDNDQDNEKPQHERYLSAYQIGKYLVSNAEYQEFVEAGGYEDKRWWTEVGWHYKEQENWREPRYRHSTRFNLPNRPVVGVSWFECVAYCRWLSAESGQHYRLPTEAEWEKAARGVKGWSYPWGDKFEAGRLNAKAGQQIVMSPTPVGVYPGGASSFGAFDCAGNVWEWCATKTPGFHFKPYPYNIMEDEWTPGYLADNHVRVLRGGSWRMAGHLSRCAYRYRSAPGEWYLDRGFRLVLSTELSIDL